MSDALVAYFTMEIALEAGMPTYAGGLGVLAGDMVRASAELKVPMVAVTLLHRKGYFRQEIDASGWQRESPCEWDFAARLEEQAAKISVEIESRAVSVRAWKYEVRAANDFALPVLFLDTDLPENSDWDRTLTHYLYGGEAYYRICQEMVLGIGGVRMLRALGYTALTRYHMNEGHAAFLGLELLDEAAAEAGRAAFTHADVESVRRKCVFTTHTPVASGHDQFPMDLAMRVLRRHEVPAMQEVFCCEGLLNMTFLALNLSHFVNGVAKKHAATSQLMFGRYKIHSITNGVHAATWTSQPFQKLFDRFIHGWREDNFGLRFAHHIPLTEIHEAHREAKALLLERVRAQAGMALDSDVFTIGFARRATAYKRNDLLVSQPERLRAIAAHAGPIQIIYAGKAHPNDHQGKEAIQHIIHAIETLRGQVPILYLTNYDTELARLMVAGVDLWVNTPQPPLEASGTSGMKAALNAVPSLSVLDGWWIEGWIEGETGWAIGEPRPENHEYGADHAAGTDDDAASMYHKLENVIVPLFYRDRDRYTDVMRHALSLNGSFFNTQRMVSEYVIKAYFE
jgi:starch phosphorylase